MIKKVLLLVIALNSLAIGLSVFQSCGLLKYDASICDIYFSYVTQETNETSSDFGRIDFELFGNDNCQQAFNNFRFDLIQTCYATTKCAKWQNSIDKSSIQIIFDRKIVLENDTIISGENILQYEKINSATEIIIENDCKAKLIKLSIAGETGRLIEFEEGIYQISFKCSTSDSRDLEETFQYQFIQ